MAADILLADLTNATSVTDGASNGTGALDRLMNTINLYLDDQYTRGRIKGTDYANVLLGSIQSVLSASLQFTLTEKVNEAQIALYDRQKEGFADDAKQKLLKTLLDTWSVGYSSAPSAHAIPDAITGPTLDKVAENAISALGIPEAINMTMDTIN
jgi:hypothetical protein